MKDTGSYYCSAISGQAVSQAADLVVVGMFHRQTDILTYTHKHKTRNHFRLQ